MLRRPAPARSPSWGAPSSWENGRRNEGDGGQRVGNLLPMAPDMQGAVFTDHRLRSRRYQNLVNPMAHRACDQQDHRRGSEHLHGCGGRHERAEQDTAADDDHERGNDPPLHHCLEGRVQARHGRRGSAAMKHTFHPSVENVSRCSCMPACLKTAFHLRRRGSWLVWAPALKETRHVPEQVNIY